MKKCEIAVCGHAKSYNLNTNIMNCELRGEVEPLLCNDFSYYIDNEIDREIETIVSYSTIFNCPYCNETHYFEFDEDEMKHFNCEKCNEKLTVYLTTDD